MRCLSSVLVPVFLLASACATEPKVPFNVFGDYDLVAVDTGYGSARALVPVLLRSASGLEYRLARGFFLLRPTGTWSSEVERWDFLGADSTRAVDQGSGRFLATIYRWGPNVAVSVQLLPAGEEGSPPLALQGDTLYADPYIFARAASGCSLGRRALSGACHPLSAPIR